MEIKYTCGILAYHVYDEADAHSHWNWDLCVHNYDGDGDEIAVAHAKESLQRDEMK